MRSSYGGGPKASQHLKFNHSQDPIIMSYEPLMTSSNAPF